MKVKNRWNGKIYTIKSFDGPADEVTLKSDDDGYEFTIAQEEFKFSYKEVKDEHGRN